MRTFPVVIERESAGYYVASVPGLPGCHTQAKSLDEPAERMRNVPGHLGPRRLGSSRHAREEMANDKLQSLDIVNVLRAGWMEFAELVDGARRYRFTTNRMKVVIPFRSLSHVVVVTA